MYTLKDNGVLTEIICGNNFEYILENNSYFANTDYKVLQSQTNGIFVPCMKMTRNGKIDLYYVTNDYRPMSSMFMGITADTLVNVVVNLFASIIEVRNNGFLACQSIDLSWDKIFVEQNTLKVKLVYLPITAKSFDSYSEFESELRSSLVKLINRVIPVNNPRINQFLEDLSNGTLTLEDVYNKSRNSNTPPIDKKENRNAAPNRNIAKGESIKLVALNAPNSFEIEVDRDVLVIGKKPELVDKAVTYNNMISRKHCRLTKSAGAYYLSDEGSANGTFINGTRLMPGQLSMIKRGDIIRLADSEFQVV